VRQVAVMHTCLREQQDTCESFVTCLDQLKPQES